MSILLSSSQQDLLDSITPLHKKMISTTIEMCNTNSGSYNKAGIKQAQQQVIDLFEPLSEQYETLELEAIKKLNASGDVDEINIAPMQVFRARPSAPLQILCTGHIDTVFPAECEFQSCWVEGNHLRGPGTADMKGGLVVLATALEALHNSEFKHQFGFTVAVSPEEEIGSPSSGDVLMRLAKDKDFGLTYEPALSDGTLAGARKGSGNFSLVAKGLSTHAGREFFQGKNAVLAIAQACSELAKLSNEETGITINIGKIEGGGAVNVVPDLCSAHFNIRMHEQAHQKQIEDNMQRIIEDVKSETGCEITLHGKFNRPPKPMTDDQLAMFELLKKCGEKMGLEIRWKATGGCCEGNNLAAAGLINIDTLGVRGANIHSDAEFACIDSFVERAKLSALLITHLIDYQSQLKT